MINWTYKKEDFKHNDPTLIPEGDHRVVVSRVSIKTYSSGNDGFEIMLDVSGHPNKLWHRIIMDPLNPEKTNHNLGKFFESFGITDYDLNNYEDWIGKDGAVRVKHEVYNGAIMPKILFCITRAYQEKLPAWGQASYIRTNNKPDVNRLIETINAATSNSSFNSTPPMPNEYVPPKNEALKINPPVRDFTTFSF